VLNASLVDAAAPGRSAVVRDLAFAVVLDFAFQFSGSPGHLFFGCLSLFV
jgi:hypothetical protein